MDILDTSFIRGTKKSDILEIAKVRPLAVSPDTLWEILCHLDEVRERETAEELFSAERVTSKYFSMSLFPTTLSRSTC